MNSTQIIEKINHNLLHFVRVTEIHDKTFFLNIIGRWKCIKLMRKLNKKNRLLLNSLNKMFDEERECRDLVLDKTINDLEKI